MSLLPESPVGYPDLSAQQFPASALYMVATPIGNLADMTLRALECIRRMDAVAAEDTRMTRRLLSHYGLDKPCLAIHTHNERAAAKGIVARLAAGERIAYVSDAGTPAISDPGARLVEAVREAGMRVIPIPGASAIACAMSVAGLAQSAFYFGGFLPSKRGQAETVLKPLAALHATLAFYEAPHRVIDTVTLLSEFLGAGRRIVIARELTKVFETVHVCLLAEAASWLVADPNRQRGEFVLLVEGAQEDADPLATAVPILHKLMRALPLSEAVDLTCELTGAQRKLLYACALEQKRAAENNGLPDLE